MVNFTPGPWEVVTSIRGDNEHLIAWVDGKNQGEYRQIICNTYIEDHEDNANINLIAAAPEMYKALTEKVCGKLCFECEDEENEEDFCEIARVLAKAEGKEVD